MSLKPLDVAQKVKELASLPEVCIKINEIADDPNASTQSIKAVIETDAALTTRILKLANSSFYGNATQVDDLNRAIMMIGTQGIRDIAWASSAMSSFKALSNDFVDMSTFWRHSLYAATVARALAAKCRVIHKDRLFLSGLLHDIGHLALYQIMPEEMNVVFERVESKDEPIQVAEKSILGFTHAAVGFALLKLWKVPDSVCRAVAYHHVPGKAEEYRLESAIVHISDEIAKMADIRGNRLDLESHIHEDAWRITGLTANIIEPIMQISEQNYLESLSLYLSDQNINSAA